MWIKICGITSCHDAQFATAAGASAIGLNFFSGSRRFVSLDRATEIRQSVGVDTDVVGVFVNSSAEDVDRIVRQVQLTAVQFHGDESDDLLRLFHRLQPNVAIIRACRLNRANLETVRQHIHRLRQVVPLTAVLIDASVSGEYGGTGQQVEQMVVQSLRKDPGIPPLILAGGLTADNVADVVQAVDPWGVDTASGVETAPGIKDADCVRRFVLGAGGGRTRLNFHR